MSRFNFHVWLVTLVLVAFLTSDATAQSSAPQTITSATDVITNWNIDQHLYVKGDLGVGAEQLTNLETWLDQHAPHWTIVLMTNANDEVYHDEDKRIFYGMDAVEHALGHGLSNRTDFGSLLHPQTGETNGAVLVIFLEERRFSYFSSVAQDNRGVGRSRWIGNLDRHAIRAMRNGRRIADAVKDTINSIDGELAATLKAEDVAANRQKIRQQRATEERRRELTQLESQLTESLTVNIPRVEESARKIRNAFPDAENSELGRPPIDNWKTKIADLQRDLTQIKPDDKNPYQRSSEYAAVVQKTNQLRGEIDYRLDLYAAHKSFAEMLSPVEKRLDLIADHPTGAAIPSADEAYRTLDEARLMHARGEVDFSDHIRRVSDLTEQAERAVELEEQRLIAEANRKSIIRKTLAVAGIILSAMLLGVLWLLNLRRRPALKRAHLAYDRKSRALELELASLQPMRQRVAAVLGSPEQFAERKFTGQTATIGKGIFSAQNQMEAMSAVATEVVTSASLMLNPSNPVAEAANLFSSSRYDHCLNLLEGASLRLPASIAADRKTGDHQSDWLTFDQFFQQLRAIQSNTETQLGSLENSFQSVQSELDRLETKLTQATELNEKLSTEARMDRLFRVPALHERLLPKMQAALAVAEESAIVDPLSTTQSLLPSAHQKIDNGLAIARSVETIRARIFPQLELAAKELKQLNYNVRWIEKSVSQLSERANLLLNDAVKTDISESAKCFDHDVHALGIRAKRCVELATEISKKVAPSLDRLDLKIKTSRSELAQQLSLPAEQVLRESGYNPDDVLQQSRLQLKSAEAAIHYGGVESVLESLEVIEIETALAENWIAQTQSAAKNHAANLKQRLEQHAELAQQLPSIATLVEKAEHKFASSAMRLRPPLLVIDERSELEPPADELPTESIITLQSQAVQLLDSTKTFCQSAQQLHSSGRVLEAANGLQLLDGEFAVVRDLLAVIKDHCSALDEQMLDNQSEWRQRLNVLETLTETAADPRTQPISVERLEQLKSSTADARTCLENSTAPIDPFADQRRLAQLAFSADLLAAMLIADRQAHGAAQSSVEAAARELKTAQQSVFRSINDKIPDSQTTKRLQQQIEKLESRLSLVASELETAHQSWSDIAASANGITSELALSDGQLRRELAIAKQAAETLESAANTVFNAANWSGPYGITVVMSPGDLELRQARQAISEGDYQKTIEFSHSAKQRADSAIASANRLVRERRRQRDAEARARRRDQNSAGISFLSSSSSSGSAWSSSAGSGWSGGSSSNSSSSRSSDSGFSRSGW